MLLCCFAEVIEVTANDPQKGTGVLIVTYNTGRNGERLDRVRFRLISESKEQTMYPRAGAFYDKGSANLRRVTITDLPAGRYTVEFIAPNQDGLFGELPQREVLITDGEIAKLDQAIKPHYARVTASAVLPDPIPMRGLSLRLCDGSGTCIASSHNGQLSTNNLLPGHYTLFFDEFMEYIPPDPVHFDVTPSAVIGPFERHYRRYGVPDSIAVEKNTRPRKRQGEHADTLSHPVPIAEVTISASPPASRIANVSAEHNVAPQEKGVSPERWSLLYPMSSEHRRVTLDED